MAQEIGVREVIEQLDRRVERVEHHVRELRREMVAWFRWSIGITVTLTVTMWVTLGAAVLLS